MSYEYSENELVQNSAIELLRDTLGWRTFYAYNDEVLGNASSSKSLGRSSYKEILLTRYLKEAVFKFNDWVADEIFEQNEPCISASSFHAGFCVLRPAIPCVHRKHTAILFNPTLLELSEKG